MTIRLNACMSCARWNRADSSICDAFPTLDADGIGIPDEIAFEGNPHVTPFAGDHDLQWTPDPVYASAEVKRIHHPFPWMVPGTDAYNALQAARRSA